MTGAVLLRTDGRVGSEFVYAWDENPFDAWVENPPYMRGGRWWMSHYRRAFFPGGCYFFTVVTWRRRPLFAEASARRDLRRSWEVVRERRPFEVVALCLLPDHLHCIWELPEGDAAFSKRWAAIKAIFAREYLRSGERSDGRRNRSRRRSREAAVWQRRFWEHFIRDQMDLERHVDYIHRNPVKHGYVTDPAQWPWSTYHHYGRVGP